MTQNAEQQRLTEERSQQIPWKKWGPYLSERQWGTVREDYSQDGNAWNYFTHDQARSRAYRWGEDGLAGFSDDKQRLCLALAVWNGADPILKERLFGLTNSEGNHGEDVKEYYFYLDGTPTHSYMKYLYKYPQRAYPYEQIVTTNKGRSRQEPEFELIDTGIFDENRYFDVFVEYAKESPEDLLMLVTVANRGPEKATLHVLPTVWFRNTWSADKKGTRPTIERVKNAKGAPTLRIQHPELGERYVYAEENAAPLFTENETNNVRLFQGTNATRYVKDGINDFVVYGNKDAINPEQRGTKVALHHVLEIGAGESKTVRLRLSQTAPSGNPLDKTFDGAIQARRADADAFYAAITPSQISADEKLVMRQALAGMLWTKQYYGYDLNRWLDEHGVNPLAATRSPLNVRNKQWFHMVSDDVISMPDKWEYPWFAAWDLAFHTIALGAADVDFAKDQLKLMLRDAYQHPNGQLAAYEWNFGDVNPPVHAWATLFIYRLEKTRSGTPDTEFLKTMFHKLMLNFTWWVNRKDRQGSNVFEGGFLGLDNIGVFDRSSPLPTGGYLEQADGTAWMALFCQNMLEMALELAVDNTEYEDLAVKFIQHFLWVASSMDRPGDVHDELWDEEDGFFYDVLRLPDGGATRLKVRSVVGLLPLCATTVIESETLKKVPGVAKRIREFMERNPEITDKIPRLRDKGVEERRIFSILDETKLRRVLARMLDENEFLSDYGIRSLSRFHAQHPYTFDVGNDRYQVSYLPGDSDSGMFGGNSNWRGPIWFPINALIIRALLQCYTYYGDDFVVECPTGSGNKMNLFQVSEEISRRLGQIFLRDENGRRPFNGDCEKFQSDPHWRDCLLFHEYFHGDSGLGIGANHQTGWTGIIGKLIQLYGSLDSAALLKGGRSAMFKTAE